MYWAWAICLFISFLGTSEIGAADPSSPLCGNSITAITLFERPTHRFSTWKEHKESSRTQYQKIGEALIQDLPKAFIAEFLGNENAGEESKVHDLGDGRSFTETTILPGDRIRVKIPQLATSRNLIAKENPFLARLIGAVIKKSKPYLFKLQSIIAAEKDFSPAMMNAIMPFQGEASVMGIQMEGHEEQSETRHSLEREEGQTGPLTANSSSLDRFLVIDAHFWHWVNGNDPKQYTGKLYFVAVHTHPGIGAPLNQTDIDGARSMYRWAREKFPKAQIQVDMVAVPTETFGKLVYVSTIGSDTLPYSIENMGPAH